MNAVRVAPHGRVLGAYRRPALRVGGAILLAVLAVLPFGLDEYQLSLLGQALAFALFALALDLVWGVAGVLSFGHAAFFGLGAYGFGLLMRDISFAGESYVGLLVAMAAPALLAFVLGYFTFSGRVAISYFAIITLAASLMLEQVAISWTGLTGGTNGLYPVEFITLGIPGLAEFTFNSVTEMYFLALGALVICFAAVVALVRSGLGQALVASEANEQRAELLGYRTRRLKVVALAVSGGLAGLAGALYAPMVGFVNPNLLGVLLSTQALIWVALGGRGTLFGGILGAVLIVFVSDYLSGTFAQVWLLLLGALLLLVVLFRPQGLLGGGAVRRMIGTR
jgi:urea ABC transporter permease protein UrtC